MEFNLETPAGSTKRLEDAQSASSPGRVELGFAHQLHPAEVLERIADAYLVLDLEWRIIYANLRACQINQKPLDEFIGKTQWEDWPGSVGSEIERQYRKAAAENIDVPGVGKNSRPGIPVIGRSRQCGPPDSAG